MCCEDSFVTKSGRNVALRIWVNAGDEERTKHAMDSLKAAFKWDEEVREGPRVMPRSEGMGDSSMGWQFLPFRSVLRPLQNFECNDKADEAHSLGCPLRDPGRRGEELCHAGRWGGWASVSDTVAVDLKDCLVVIEG